MLLRFLPLVLTIAVLAECASRPTCDATTCKAGCCDTSNSCVAGNMANACGAPGSGACAVCMMGQMCVMNACTSGSSGGGSAAGGGTAATGGGSGGGFGGGLSTTCPQDGGDALCLGGVCVDGVCVPDNNDSGTGGGGEARAAFQCSTTRTIDSFDGPLVDAGYDLYNWLLLAQPDPRSITDGGTWEQLELQLNTGLRPNQPIPGPVDLDGGDEDGQPLDYFKCGVCPVFYETCSGPTTCGRTYLGISGHVDVHQLSLALHGTAYATMSNVTLVEWDFLADQPAPDSGCVVIGAATFDAGW
jgi:hypothetical protein